MSDAYRVETTFGFEREFKNLDPAIARRIRKKIDHLAAHPELISQPLRNPPPDLAGIHKYRIGDYRVLLWVDHNSRVMTFHAVGHRSEIYRNL